MKEWLDQIPGLLGLIGWVILPVFLVTIVVAESIWLGKSFARLSLLKRKDKKDKSK